MQLNVRHPLLRTGSQSFSVNTDAAHFGKDLAVRQAGTSWHVSGLIHIIPIYMAMTLNIIYQPDCYI